MRFIGRVVGISLTLAALGSTAWGEVTPTTVGELAASSDVVVIGTVDRIVEMPVQRALRGDDRMPATIHFARVAVDEWLEGEPRSAHVWYQADPTWECDTSTAVANERILVFLRRSYTVPREPGAPAAHPGTAPDRIPIHRITWSGRGRMPIRKIAGELHADVIVVNVGLPAEVEVLPPDILALERVKGWARLDDLRRLLPRTRPGPTSPHGAELLGVTALLRRIEGRGGPGGAHGALVAYDELAARLDEVRPHLLTLLADPGAAYRRAATLLLGAEGVAPWLESEDVLERRAAAWALQTLATEEGSGLSPLTTQLTARSTTDPDAEVRWRSLRALVPRGRASRSSSLADSQVRALVLAGMADSSPVVARQAVEAVAAMEPWVWSGADAVADRRRVLASLDPLAVGADVGMQRAAWAAIAALHGDAAEAFLASRRGSVDGLDVVARRSLVASLGFIPGATTLGRLARLLIHPDPWVRGAAVHGLAVRDDPIAIGVMVLALLDADDSVAEGALREIERLESKALEQAAVPGLRLALARAQDPGRQAHLSRVLSDLSR